MRYDIEEIIGSAFEFDDLYHYPELRSSIIDLLKPSEDKIKTTRALLSQADLPWLTIHHIKIRLELLEEII